MPIKRYGAEKAGAGGQNLYTVEDCVRRNVQFGGADLTNARAERTRFDGADLPRTNLRAAKLSGASFVGANLLQSAFTGFCPAGMVMKKLGIGRNATGSCCN